MGLRFSFVTPGLERSSLDYLRAVKNKECCLEEEFGMFLDRRLT